MRDTAEKYAGKRSHTPLLFIGNASLHFQQVAKIAERDIHLQIREHDGLAVVLTHYTEMRKGIRPFRFAHLALRRTKHKEHRTSADFYAPTSSQAHTLLTDAGL